MIERAAVFAQTFENSGDAFSGLAAAKRWLEDAGFSVGPTCAQADRIAVRYGRWWRIAKWRDLTAAEVAAVDGVVSGDFRAGPVTVRLFMEPGG